jgi:hypothetical protein
VRNIAVALGVLPGLLYGLASVVLGFSGLLGLPLDLLARVLGFVLAAAACHCVWRLVKGSRVGQAFARSSA